MRRIERVEFSEFEWDESKRLATLIKSGLDFRVVAFSLLAPHVEPHIGLAGGQKMSKDNTVRYSADEIRRMVSAGETRSDWAKFDSLTDEEIEANMRDDPDWADFTDIDWSKATLVVPVPKDPISIRLDSDVLDFFKASGKGYQTRINAVLRHYMDEMKKAGKAG